MDTKHAWSRRDFLQTLSSGVPTLALIARQTNIRVAETEGVGGPPTSEKFTPIDLSRYFDASPAQFGERDEARQLSGESARDGLDRKSTRLNSSHMSISYAVFCL